MVRKDQIQVLPSCASLPSSFHLAHLVMPEDLSNPLRQVDHSMTALRFRVKDAQLALLQIDILPLQLQQLIAPHPCDKGQRDNRF